MSDGILGWGASVKIAAAATNLPTTNATAIGNIISIGGPEEARDAIDISTMDSTNKWREFIPGMLDAGELTLEINYDGTALGTANSLATWFTNDSQFFQVTFNDHTQETNKSYIRSGGFLTGLGHAIPFDDKVTQTVTIKLTGQPTYSDAG
jgi:predicted secreted protein